MVSALDGIAVSAVGRGDGAGLFVVVSAPPMVARRREKEENRIDMAACQSVR
jgi:hypothetical protein